MTTGYDVAAAARRRIGMRWKHQAATDGVACDCWGLILLVALELSIPGAAEAAVDYDLQAYGRDPDYAKGIAACRRYMTEVPKIQATVGDVLYMRVPRGTHPQHFGFQSADDPPYMIHAWAFSRGVVENRIDDVWRSRIVHVFRFPGLE